MQLHDCFCNDNYPTTNIGCKSAILAVNVIGGILEPAKTYLSELCIKPARIPTIPTNQVKTEKPTKHRKKKKKKQQ